jgi:hypothetical protein
MKLLLALICGATLITAHAQTQSNTNASTTGSQPSTTSNTGNTTSTNTDTSGTVTAYTPGAAITIDPGTGKPVHFVVGDKVQVIGPDGKVLANTDVRKNAKVHVRLVQQGDRTVVDQINVEDLQK